MKKKSFYIITKAPSGALFSHKVDGYVTTITTSDGHDIKIGIDKRHRHWWVATELSTGATFGCSDTTKSSVLERAKSQADKVYAALNNPSTPHLEESRKIINQAYRRLF